ncbi:MAG: hypothetical protein U9N85_03045 [Bacteroidota bacterium]|nr:hypothetical protein [Bacteroidota bacterium]
MNLKIIKELGYTKDREGLISRYINEKENWDAHLQNCKKIILQSAQNKKKETAVVLGSGWWLDTPVEALSKQFKTLFLVDISHPRQRLKKAEQFDNVKMVSGDITGIIEPLYDVIKHNKRQTTADEILSLVNQAKPFQYLNLPDADFRVSINLLSQLGIFIEKYIRKKTKLSNDEIKTIIKSLQEVHINYLPKGKSCLITDYKENLYQPKTNTKTSEDLILTPLNNYTVIKKWTWDFDLSGNYSKNQQAVLKVIALEL